jgi:hypothetical protein
MGNPVGAPTKYSEEYPDKAYKLCLLGATDKQLADFFEVEEKTINNWKKEHPLFLQSIKAGKEEADAKIAEALYHRALGYEHDDVDIKSYQGDVIITPIKKKYPPDVTAIIYWLNNRQKDTWRNKIDMTSDGEKLGVTLSESQAEQLIRARARRTPS